MSIAVVNQTYDEIRRLMIAGSGLAAEDFRLKKLVPPLRKSAAKAPVFGRVADGIEKLLESSPEGSARALLDLAALVTAILYTQGQTGLKGSLEPIGTEGLELTTSEVSGRHLRPLIAALTSPGSGRLEIIRDAYQRDAFNDLRLVRPAIQALDDTYKEIAEFVGEHILPRYGKAIHPQVSQGFRIDGKTADARRLRLMHRLDPEATRDLVTEALEHGSKEVKLAALGCLEGRLDAVDFLLEQSRARSQEVRRAAYASMATIDHPDIVDRLIEHLQSKDVEFIAPYIGAHPNRKLRRAVVDQIIEHRAFVFDPEGAMASAAGDSQTKRVLDALKRLEQLVDAVPTHDDEEAEMILCELYADRGRFTSGPHHFEWGLRLMKRVARALADTGSTRSLRALAEAGPSADDELFGFAFTASLLIHRPQRVYEEFSPLYRDRPSGRTKAADVARQKAELIGRILRQVFALDPTEAPTRHLASIGPMLRSKSVKLDPRWQEAAIAVSDPYFVAASVGPNDRDALAYLLQLLDQFTTGPVRDQPYLSSVARALLRVEHPEAVSVLVRLLRRLANRGLPSWALRLIPDLPEEAVAPLEEFAPKMGEEYLRRLDDLKRKHGSCVDGDEKEDDR